MCCGGFTQRDAREVEYITAVSGWVTQRFAADPTCTMFSCLVLLDNLGTAQSTIPDQTTVVF